MDCRAVLLFSLAALFLFLFAHADGYYLWYHNMVASILPMANRSRSLRRALVTICEGIGKVDATVSRTKKVVIHVPYKVKKIKHTHTVYKTIHHHHTHHDAHLDHGVSPSEEHEHFHHMHIHDEPPLGQHTQPIPGIGIPEFLPDVPLDVAMSDLPDLPRDLPIIPKRPIIPLFRH